MEEARAKRWGVAKQVRTDTFGKVLRVSDVSTAEAAHKAKHAPKRNAVQAVGEGILPPPLRAHTRPPPAPCTLVWVLRKCRGPVKTLWWIRVWAAWFERVVPDCSGLVQEPGHPVRAQERPDACADPCVHGVRHTAPHPPLSLALTNHVTPRRRLMPTTYDALWDC